MEALGKKSAGPRYFDGEEIVDTIVEAPGTQERVLAFYKRLGLKKGRVTKAKEAE